VAEKERLGLLVAAERQQHCEEWPTLTAAAKVAGATA